MEYKRLAFFLCVYHLTWYLMSKLKILGAQFAHTIKTRPKTSFGKWTRPSLVWKKCFEWNTRGWNTQGLKPRGLGTAWLRLPLAEDSLAGAPLRLETPLNVTWCLDWRMLIKFLLLAMKFLTTYSRCSLLSNGYWISLMKIRSLWESKTYPQSAASFLNS